MNLARYKKRVYYLSEIDEGTVNANLSPDLQYACRYWITHLEHSRQDIIDKDTTLRFLQKHFLHWLEAMSLMRESSRSVHLLDSLRALSAVRALHHIFLVPC